MLSLVSCEQKSDTDTRSDSVEHTRLQRYAMSQIDDYYESATDLYPALPDSGDVEFPYKVSELHLSGYGRPNPLSPQVSLLFNLIMPDSADTIYVKFECIPTLQADSSTMRIKVHEDSKMDVIPIVEDAIDTGISIKGQAKSHVGGFKVVRRRDFDLEFYYEDELLEWYGRRHINVVGAPSKRYLQMAEIMENFKRDIAEHQAGAISDSVFRNILRKTRIPGFDRSKIDNPKTAEDHLAKEIHALKNHHMNEQRELYMKALYLKTPRDSTRRFYEVMYRSFDELR